MENNFSPSASQRTATSAFHDYVRGVFADRSTHAPRLRAARADWLRRFWERAAPSPAEQRWEDEGGSSA